MASPLALGRLTLLLGILIGVPAVSAEIPPEKIVPLDVKGVELDMAGIPAGTFAMGTDPSAPRFQRDEGPLTTVNITHPFWLGRTELTQAQWEALDMPNNSYHRGSNRPVTNATWEQAMEYCRRLTKHERRAGRLPEGYAYTLPTEAQGEYACRAGASGDYAGELDELAWYSGNSEGETHPVAQKRPNAWGLYDMHGNVLEWCRDWYGSYAGGQRDDPKGVSEGSVRVIRGGSWGYGAVFCRSAYRVRLRPDSRWVIVGFRVALAPVEPKPWWDFRSDPAAPSSITVANNRKNP